MAISSKKIGIILIQTGGPESVSRIRGFLFSLFSDRFVIRLPFFLRIPLAFIVAFFRSFKVAKLYERIGGSSPVNKTTALQAELLETALRKKGLDARVTAGMRYAGQSVGQGLKILIGKGVQSIIAIPLFPHYSHTTTGSALDCFEGALKKLGFRGESSYVMSFATHPSYIDALKERLDEALSAVPENLLERTAVLFSAHSLPESYVKSGDPYPQEIDATIKALTRFYPEFKFTFSYQSKVGPVRWLKPTTEEAIAGIAKSGFKGIVVVPISFVSDHFETLYEIDILYREYAMSKGIEFFTFTRGLNDLPLFIESLAELVMLHPLLNEGRSAKGFASYNT
ncbi:MAG: ferrochelatase [Deltaproteobacteria bacterium]|nr:ferrochelatase [Deltaproteobacteria bacterium]